MTIFDQQQQQAYLDFDPAILRKFHFEFSVIVLLLLLLFTLFLLSLGGLLSSFLSFL